jgi:hypothetical protein
MTAARPGTACATSAVKATPLPRLTSASEPTTQVETATIDQQTTGKEFSVLSAQRHQFDAENAVNFDFVVNFHLSVNYLRYPTDSMLYLRTLSIN